MGGFNPSRPLALALVSLVCLISIFFLLVSATCASAARQVTLQWDPNTEPDLAGYRVFQRTNGQSYTYGLPVWEGTASECTIGSLNEATDYYFVVRAFDTEGLESDDSAEVHLQAMVAAPATYNLAVNAAFPGQVTLSPAGGAYTAGTSVTLTAVAPDGWDFTGWSGTVTGTANPATVVMDAHKIVTAAFAESTSPPVDAPESPDPEDSAPQDPAEETSEDSAAQDPAEETVVQDSPTDETQDQGATETLTSDPNTDAGAAPAAPSGVRQVTLQWDPNTEPDLAGYRVFQRTNGQSYTYGLPVWEGTASECTIGSLDEATDYYFVVRAFDTEGLESDDSAEVHLQATVATPATPATYNLAVNAAFPGQVTLSPAGGAYTAGTSVTLTAVTPDSWDFTGWSGAVTGTANPATVVMDAHKIVTAAFAEHVVPNYNLATHAQGSGTISRVPDLAGYSNGTSVSLTAVPDAGWMFMGWSGAVSGTVNPATLVVDGNKIVTANFAMPEIPRYNLSVSQDGEGSISLNPPTGTYDEGTTVSLVAAPGAGWTFGGWGGAVTGDGNPATVTMTGHKIVQATFLRANAGPTADAGPNQSVPEGHTVVLNGSGSTDPDNGIAAYKWSQTFGQPVILSSNTSPNPTFTAPDVGMGGEKLVFRLRVTDPSGLQDSDSCAVNVTWVNEPPEADAGPDQKVNEKKTVQLNASGSMDADDGIIAYRWTQISGPAVRLSDPNSVQPTFQGPDVGPRGASLVFELTVKDRYGLAGRDTCVVNVTWQNEPPEADAGPELTVDGGEPITLDGSGSLDMDDAIAGYHWRQVSGTPVTLSDPFEPKPVFTAPMVGMNGDSLKFELTVTDTQGLMDTDACVVNVVRKNEPPTAVVAEDYIEAEPNTVVVLDGSGSTDVDDGIRSYCWTQVEGAPVNMETPCRQMVSFVAPDTDAYGSNLVFRLTVQDRGGLKSTSTSSVFITPSMGHRISAAEVLTVLKVDISGDTLIVIAASDSPGDTVTLRASAHYGDRTVVLGKLKYQKREGHHRQKFSTGMDTLPDAVTIASSGGGTITVETGGTASQDDSLQMAEIPMAKLMDAPTTEEGVMDGTEVD